MLQISFKLHSVSLFKTIVWLIYIKLYLLIESETQKRGIRLDTNMQELSAI